MAEIIIKDDETPAEVARRLLDQAEHPDHVVWTPRSNTHPHGGVFVVPDDEVEALVARVEAKRNADAAAVQQRLDAAAERDELADRTGLTPAELGFAANGPDDTVSIGQAPPPVDGDDEGSGDTDDEGGPAKEIDEADEDQSAANRAAARAAARKASRKKSTTAADEAAESDKE